MSRPPSPPQRRGAAPRPVKPRLPAPLVARLGEAVALHRAGRLAAAGSLYAEVLAAAPDEPDALHLLGLVHHQGGDSTTASPLIDRAIAGRPDIAAYHTSRSAVRLALGDAVTAVAAARAALRLAPGAAEAHMALGLALAASGATEGAITALGQALALRPDTPEALNSLGALLARVDRLAEAEAALRRAVALRPESAGPLTNLGLVLRDQGRAAEARAAFDAAVAADPDHPTARANRALALLQAGEWEEGWAEYEWRWRADGFAVPRAAPAAPAWDGGDPAGRTLLLRAEQGYGSVIQFVRYAIPLAGRGARLILECQPPLVGLFRHALSGPQRPLAAVIGRGDAVPSCDAEVPLMSLPHLLGTTPATVPATVPYLAADPLAVAGWRQELAAHGRRRRIGLAWAGHPGHGNDRHRSLPAAATLALLAPLLDRHPDVAWISLQVGGPAAAAAAPLAAHGLIDPTARLADFAATAALVDALDLVIAVDTAVAHLAGALAKPVWLLLPFVGEWRWLADRDDTPWYPTMRLFRQAAAGDWRELLGRVAAALDAGSGR